MAANDEAHMRRALDLALGAVGGASRQIRWSGRSCGAATRSSAGVVRRPSRRAPCRDQSAAGSGGPRRGATVVCTLEPSITSVALRRGTHALIDAGVARVVVATGDPNPVVDAGVRPVASGGIAVETGVLAAEAREDEHRRSTATSPPLSLRAAQDASSSTGRPQRPLHVTLITGRGRSLRVHRLRAWADACGRGRRNGDRRRPGPHGTRSRRRIGERAAAGRGRLDGSRARRAAWVRRFAAHADRDDERTPGPRSAVGHAGAEVAVIDRDATVAVALRSLIAELGKRDVQGLLVEGVRRWPGALFGRRGRSDRGVSRSDPDRWIQRCLGDRGARVAPLATRRASPRSRSRLWATT